MDSSARKKNVDLHNLIEHRANFNSMITHFTLLVKKKLSSIRMPKYLIVTNNNNKKSKTQEIKRRK